MVLALAFALVAGAIAVKTATSVSALNNVPPVAEAGPDQAVQSTALNVHSGGYPLVTLDGSKSFDTDGAIVSYAWTQVASGINADYSPANLWPTVVPAGATITTPSAAVTTVSLPSAGLYIFKLTVTDNGTIPHADSASDLVVVVAGKTWFVSIFQANPLHTTWDTGNDTYDGTSPVFTTGIIGPWRTITHAIQSATVLQGDMIMVSPNQAAGSQPSAPKYNTSGFGGSSNSENIVIDKWLTVWSANGRDDILNGLGQEIGEFATTIGVGSQSPIPAQVVAIIWPHGVSDLSKTDGLNAERTGVIFGGDGHGFNLLGAPIGIFAGSLIQPLPWSPLFGYLVGDVVESPSDDAEYNFQVTVAGTSGSTEPAWDTSAVGATTVDGTVTWTYLGEREGADSVDIYQNRIEEPTSIPEGLGPNYIGIEVDDSKAPTVDDNIIHFDFDDVDGSLIGITLTNCDETLGVLVIAVVYYLTPGNVFSPNLMGGAQVINNVVLLADQNNVIGITLTECPKAWVYNNTVNTNVKKCDYAISVGIELFDCDHSVVDSNTVVVAVDGEITAAAEGILIVESHSVTVSNNDIEIIGVGDPEFSLGGLLGVGIVIEESDKATVVGNTVDVDNTAIVASEVVASGDKA